MNWLLSLLFPCAHDRTTFPLTLKRRTYVVCLDCGSEFEYNWREMRIGSAAAEPAAELARERA